MNKELSERVEAIMVHYHKVSYCETAPSVLMSDYGDAVQLIKDQHVALQELHEAAQLFLEAVVYEVDTPQDRAEVVQRGDELNALIKPEPEIHVLKEESDESI